jgi:antitoxin (DNA-binding transcriptional repressor) of toxin-antitoxin stability system
MRATQVNIYRAKAELSALLERALAGETIVIARAGMPLARLAPIATASGAARSGVRLGGLSRKRLRLAPDFHAPMRDEDLLGA